MTGDLHYRPSPPAGDGSLSGQERIRKEAGSVADAPVRIGIDARPLRWPGIGRYVQELVSGIAELDQQDQFFVYCDGMRSAGVFRDRWPNVHVRIVSSPLYSLGEQVQLPLRIVLDRLDLFHAPSSLVVPLLHPCVLVVTLHDLLLKLHPEHLPSRLAGWYFGLMNAAALRSARRILAVSEFTRGQLVDAYPEYRDKVQAVHNGVGAAFRPLSDRAHLAALKSSLGLGERYLLYVGTYKKHKNVPLLIEAYARMRHGLREECRLVLLGRRDPRFPEADEAIERLDLGHRVTQAEGLAEEDLVALYGGAQAVVMPSIFEGFGLPLLEAMACGTPVVATRIPAFREVAGDAALYVEPGDRAAMTTALERIVLDEKLRGDLRAAGLERSASFTWRQTATQTLGAYGSALSESRSGGIDR